MKSLFLFLLDKKFFYYLTPNLISFIRYNTFPLALLSALSNFLINIFSKDIILYTKNKNFTKDFKFFKVI